MIEIVNIVGSGSIGAELALEEVRADLSVAYTEYDPDNYHGLYVRLVEDGPLITVYRSGKYIITGASSLDELHETNKGFLSTVSQLDPVDRSFNSGFTVQNIVSTEDLGQVINLNALAIALGLETTEYEPEQFPGLIYRPDTLSVVVLVFASGNVVITGTAKLETAKQAFSSLQRSVGQLQTRSAE